MNNNTLMVVEMCLCDPYVGWNEVVFSLPQCAHHCAIIITQENGLFSYTSLRNLGKVPSMCLMEHACKLGF